MYIGKSIEVIILIRHISAASSASARCSENIEAAGTPDPNKVSGRSAPDRGCLSEAKTGVKIALKRKCTAGSRALFFSSDSFELFVQSYRNVNRTSNCTTYHRVVTDSEFIPANCASECIRPIVSVTRSDLNISICLMNH